ncbi:hypothetical protein FOZ62_023407 [Perkinsus olseni]|uniref:MULE transposase domain-containing protein n=1 Tax=Perkinsus olseni TaxID=32597 RepID=A0A7J6RJJ7_PEROL|nr:hypothetical protein FOZ62_023407 [Perkinsus olseni]
MSTVNDRDRRFVNGSMGTVEAVRDQSNPLPCITVRFDHMPDKLVDIKPHDFYVYEEDRVIFSRRQVPLVLAASMTVHKTQGMTLQGAWCRFPFDKAPRGREQDISDYWGRTWLRGAAYTALSRVGDRKRIRVHPLRHSTSLSLDDVLPIFHLDADALKFDEKCRSENLLAERPTTPLAEAPTDPGPTPVQPSAEVLPTESVQAYENTKRELALLRGQMDALRSDFQAHSTRFFLSQQYGASSPSTNPVFYCWLKPHLREAVENLPTEVQANFYRRVSEELTITEACDERILRIAESFLRSEPASYGATHRSYSDRPGRTSPRPEPSRADPAETTSDRESHTGSHIWDDGEHSDRSEDSEFRAEEETDDGEGSTDPSYHEDEMPHAEGDPITEPEFEDQAFTVIGGSLSEVVEDYLAGNPHFALEHGYSIKNLKSRKSCRLQCRRGVSKRYEGKEAREHQKPDWRLWHEFTCKLSRMMVKEKNSRCYFYGLRGAASNGNEWLEHSHPYDTWKCRSRYLPPDVVDDWAFWAAEDPGVSMGDLKSRTLQRNIRGEYSSATTSFLAAGGLSETEKLRNVYRSVKENGKAGLSVSRFLTQVQPLKRDYSTLGEELIPLIASLDAIDEDRASARDVERQLQADQCLLLEDILCERQSEPGKMTSISEFSAVFTSTRMLRNLREAEALGVDTTFNVLHAKAVLGVVCRLTKKGAAKPIAVALLQSESAASIKHVLKQLNRASVLLGFGEYHPSDIVMDGSSALHRAAVDTYGDAARIISCYFHVVQQARKVKVECGLSGHLWRKIKADIETLADSWDRHEWERLRELFMAKWKPGPCTAQDGDSPLFKFLEKFGEYLDPTKWRSHWGTHVLCIAFTLGFERSPEAVRDWSTAMTRFGQPQQKRDKRGQLTEPVIPDNPPTITQPQLHTILKEPRGHPKPVPAH